MGISSRCDCLLQLFLRCQCHTQLPYFFHSPISAALNFSPFSSLLPGSAHSHPLGFPFGNHYAELLLIFFSLFGGMNGLAPQKTKYSTVSLLCVLAFFDSHVIIG